MSRREVSERETAVERPWLHADCCPCVVEGVDRVTVREGNRVIMRERGVGANVTSKPIRCFEGGTFFWGRGGRTVSLRSSVFSGPEGRSPASLMRFSRRAHWKVSSLNSTCPARPHSVGLVASLGVPPEDARRLVRRGLIVWARLHLDRPCLRRLRSLPSADSAANVSRGQRACPAGVF